MKWRDDAVFLAKRLWSVRMAALGVIWASAVGVWISLPEEWKPTIPEGLRSALVVFGVALAAAPGLAALIAQPKLAQAKEERQQADKAGA